MSFEGAHLEAAAGETLQLDFILPDFFIIFSFYFLS